MGHPERGIELVHEPAASARLSRRRNLPWEEGSGIGARSTVLSHLIASSLLIHGVMTLVGAQAWSYRKHVVNTARGCCTLLEARRPFWRSISACLRGARCSSRNPWDTRLKIYSWKLGARGSRCDKVASELQIGMVSFKVFGGSFLTLGMDLFKSGFKTCLGPS